MIKRLNSHFSKPLMLLVQVVIYKAYKTSHWQVVDAWTRKRNPLSTEAVMTSLLCVQIHTLFDFWYDPEEE